FDVATLAAVEEWQRASGENATGTLPVGSVVFLPGAVRVGTLTVASGATVQTGGSILTATSAPPAVLVPLPPRAGPRPALPLAAGTAAGARVSAIGRVAPAPPSDTSQSGPPPTPTAPATIRPAAPHGRGALDQAPVQVAITEQEDRHVLAVPISALLAQPGG